MKTYIEPFTGEQAIQDPNVYEYNVDHLIITIDWRKKHYHIQDWNDKTYESVNSVDYAELRFKHDGIVYDFPTIAKNFVCMNRNAYWESWDIHNIRKAIELSPACMISELPNNFMERLSLGKVINKSHIDLGDYNITKVCTTGDEFSELSIQFTYNNENIIIPHDEVDEYGLVDDIIIICAYGKNYAIQCLSFNNEPIK